jgi:hypothetical protein
VLEQCHAMGLRLLFAPYAVLTAVAPVGWRSYGSHRKMASPDLELC